MSFENIPAEMQAWPQWVIWRLETTPSGLPTKVPYSPHTGRLASVTDPTTWGSFNQAMGALAHAQGFNGVGFVFTAADPFAVIDLDHTDNPELKHYQQQVYNVFHGRTYEEVSQSGKGLHFVCLGKVPSGKRKFKIELYSDNRFFAMTGTLTGPYLPPVPMQPQLDWLWDALGGAEEQQVTTTAAGSNVDQTNDREVWDAARNARNGNLFNDLWQGNWQQHYSSQSEADFALIDILAFYTSSKPQVERLFLQSGLGQREKANRRDYREGMLKRAFDRQPPQVDLEMARDNVERAMQSMRAVETQAAVDAANPYTQPLPGIMGEMAYYFYSSSPRPVREIAIGATLGLMAGIIGRAWNYEGLGLNGYFAVLARSGTGKETIHRGPDRLMQAVTSVDPGGGGVKGAAEFIGPGDFASGQALIKHMVNHPSCVSRFGEFDKLLEQFAQKHTNAATQKLKQGFLSLYSRSGHSDTMQGMVYSDQDNNVPVIKSPAFSMVGEGTPGRFYKLLDEDMVADGFIPRFTVIHYDGPRVDFNEGHHLIPPPAELVQKTASLCGHSLMLNQSNQVINVKASPEAQELLRDYDNKITKLLRGEVSPVLDDIWNRASIKVKKLAATLAVAQNFIEPVISAYDVNYAISIVDYDTLRLVKRFESGEVGDTEARQFNEVRKLVKQLLSIDRKDKKQQEAQRITEKMLKDKVFNTAWLMSRATRIGAFQNDRLKPTDAMKRTLATLCEMGVLQELGPMQKQDYVARDAKLYSVIDARWLKGD